MAEAETAGVIEPGERAMIAGVMRLGDRPVRAVMTPPREVEMIDLAADPEDIRRMIAASIHSRLPVHAGTPEEMLGVVQAKDLLDAYLRDERPDIRALGGAGRESLRPLHVVYFSRSILGIMRTARSRASNSKAPPEGAGRA